MSELYTHFFAHRIRCRCGVVVSTEHGVYQRGLSQGACGVEALYLILFNELTPGPRGDREMGSMTDGS